MKRINDLERTSQILLLVALTAACLLPFAGKAFNMDDPLFIWTAKNIQSHPFDPYGFNIQWYEIEMPMSDVNKNPPLVSYFIALVGSVFGWSEPALHIAFLFPAIAVIVGTYLIARHYCATPVLAGVATLFTPVFLVSCTTIMSDVLMLAFWVFAVYSWISGLQKDSNLMLMLSVILAALSALTKYFGITLLPLLLLYSILRRHNVGKAVLFMLLPVAALAAYQWATGELYGRGLLTDAGSYAIEIPSAFGKFSFAKLPVGLSFTGGCVLAVLFLTHLIWSWKGISVGIVVTAVITIVVVMTGSLNDYHIRVQGAALWLFALELGIFISGGISLLAVAILDFIHRRDPDSALLFLWFIGTFIFAVFVNWTTAARSILPLAPAAGILMARRTEERKRPGQSISRRQILIPLIAAMAAALAVAWADYGFANSTRDAADAIIEKYENKRNHIWFTGHWGFQYYMQLNGARSFDRDRSMPLAADILVVPQNNCNIVELPAGLMYLREILEVPAAAWITTMNMETGAGFYADTWGPIPFVVGAAPFEKYQVFEVKGL